MISHTTTYFRMAAFCLYVANAQDATDTTTTSVDPCTGYTCGSNEHCVGNLGNSPFCRCNPGYTQANDSLCTFSPCEASPCGLHTACLVNLNVTDLRRCICHDGFYRDLKEVETADCKDPSNAPYVLLYVVAGVGGFIVVTFTIWFCYLARRGPTRKLGGSTPVFKSNVVRIIPVDISQISNEIFGSKASDSELILAHADDEDLTETSESTTAEHLMQTLSPEDKQALAAGEIVIKTVSDPEGSTTQMPFPWKPEDNPMQMPVPRKPEDNPIQMPVPWKPLMQETVILVPVDKDKDEISDVEILSDARRPAPQVTVEPLQTMIAVPHSETPHDLQSALKRASISDGENEIDSHM